ncbi:MAG: class II glutamine amidotransferase [Gammaproteobacteria bacterium]|nr:class II glutamine amidotransferase [Gammaproteobacteria bacterium]MCI0591692.1 class II glutamine amidotransferase [Gammaproteobacteria bacterium]
MCELLGMSANVPTDIRFSFTGLMQRGGRTGPHRDGWGIGFYEGRGCRLFHDPNASAESHVARLVQSYEIKSKIIISHIRKANRGRVCLENTHPFVRELWGYSWTFVHNGQLKGVKKLPLSFYRPIGTTDSEHAFCWMLDQIRERFGNVPRRAGALWDFIYQLASKLRERGSFNFLLSDSKHLYAHCSTNLSFITRRAPFGRARLIDAEVVIDFEKETTPKDIVTVIASRPLTHDEEWIKMKRGAFDVFIDGISMGE